MNRSSRTACSARPLRFEALQPREVMASDTFPTFDSNVPIPTDLTAQEWAERILNVNENQLTTDPNLAAGDLKKFTSQQEAIQFFTDGLTNIWKELLGKPVNNKLNVDYVNYLRYGFFYEDRIANLTLRTASVSTNNQVKSVDEADQFEVSSSGYLYTLGDDGGGLWNQVKVFDARDPKNLVNVATISAPGNNVQMHLIGNQLILVTSDWSTSSSRGDSRIQVYEVSNPAKPIRQTSLTVSGGMEQSRFSDGKLTLFGNQYVAALRPKFISDNPTTLYNQLSETPIGRFETVEEYTARIQPLVLGWLQPDVKIDGSDANLNPDDWRDLAARSNTDIRQQVSIVSFNLTDSGLQLIDSETLVGVLMGVSYVDDNTVYVTQSHAKFNNLGLIDQNLSSQTDIFSVEFDANKVEFVASGVIPGTIRDSRMMDEYQGNLRVFTNVRTWIGAADVSDAANLYNLKPNAGKLETIGSLTNVADGQALYSAYFDEDQAMITTWVSQVTQQITWRPSDPLHAFDLSNPTKPIELSELVIPGVSTYLHRVDATHLVGIGYIDVGTNDWRLQVSLYDVSDLANMKVADTWTSAQSMFTPNIGGLNQNALAVNFDARSGLFSIGSNFATTFGLNGNSQVTIFKIDPTAKDPLVFVGQAGDERASSNRSVVLGDSLLVISDAWVHSFSVTDLSNELDRELVRNPTVADWYQMNEDAVMQLAPLDNDFLADGQIVSISTSKLGTATIINGGKAIEFHAGSSDVARSTEQLTYTVAYKGGQMYSGTINIDVYGFDETAPIFIGPVFTPTIPTVVQPVVIAKQIVPGDINGDSQLSPHDLLLLVNYLNHQGEMLVAGATLPPLSASNSMMDLSGDGNVSPYDLLILVGQLNANAAQLNANAALTASGEAANSLATDNALLSMFASNNADSEENLRRSKRNQ